MKSAIIAAALCAAFCLSAPAAVQASATTATAKGPTDVQLYCTFFPWTAKCATPAPAKAAKAAVKPVAKAAVKPVTKVAMAKPAAAKPAAAKTGIKTMACVPAPKGKPYLYSCSWK